MAQLPRRLAPHLRRVAAALALALAPAAAGAGDLELPGTWHVLIHYRDAKAPNPGVDRWEDRLWVFEASGDGLRWTEYPIVIFDDESGRFERRAGTGQYARLLHFWEPSPPQLANIRAGLAVNDRGSQTKTLRRRGDAWSSGERASPGVGVITYQETWSIEQAEDRPVFRQRDVLGTEGAEGLEGLTELRTEEVREGGDLLVGRFQRDGTRTGSFELRRSGARKGLPKRTQSDLQAQAFARGLQSSSEVRGAMLEFAREELVDAGVLLSDAEIDALVEKATRLSSQGLDPGQIRGRLREQVSLSWLSFAPVGATHDDSVRYRFPFEAGTPRRLRAGVGEDVATGGFGFTSDWTGHRGWWKYSFDFELPRGTPVLAARDGEVARTGSQFTEIDPDQGRSAPSAHVEVLHADGTFAVYGHLLEVRVKVGQRVRAGDEIGLALAPRGHFGVVRRAEELRLESTSIRFDDGSAEGVVPISGLGYGGQGR